MRVRFEATIDEIVDAHLTFHLETATARRALLVARSATAVLVGLGVGYLAGAWVGVATPVAIPIGAAAAVAGWLMYDREHRKVARNHIRKVLVEQYGGDAPVPVSVAVEPEALVVEQPSSQWRVEWNRVTSMADRPEALEIRAERPASLMRVPARAFPSFAERASFVQLIRGYLGINR